MRMVMKRLCGGWAAARRE